MRFSTGWIWSGRSVVAVAVLSLVLAGSPSFAADSADEVGWISAWQRLSAFTQVLRERVATAFDHLGSSLLAAKNSYDGAGYMADPHGKQNSDLYAGAGWMGDPYGQEISDPYDGLGSMADPHGQQNSDPYAGLGYMPDPHG